MLPQRKYTNYVYLFEASHLASINLPHVSETERKLAHLAARRLHRQTLTAYLRNCLRALLLEARQKHPEQFDGRLAALRPVDRTIYHYLTHEGRRTVGDLIAEMGLPRETVKASLGRLMSAGLIGALPQGRTDTAQGAQTQIYISLAESQ